MTRDEEGTARRPIVAIDGPAGAGKSTVARRLARKLDYLYIDTGAMYRALALAAIRAGVDLDDAAAVVECAGRQKISFRNSDEGQRVLLNGEEVECQIRTAEISEASSRVSRWGPVRDQLVALQRRVAAGGGVVMEGRDIGTVVFPDAELKIFLTAGVSERARRRAAELQACGMAVDLDSVEREVTERDRRDSEREIAPLKRAPDAVEVVTDGMTIDQVIEHLASLALALERREA